MNKLKKGDSVIVIAGKDKGKKGEVVKVMENGKVLVTDINLVKKHVKPNPNKEETGADTSMEEHKYLKRLVREAERQTKEEAKKRRSAEEIGRDRGESKRKPDDGGGDDEAKRLRIEMLEKELKELEIHVLEGLKVLISASRRRGQMRNHWKKWTA